MSLGKTNLTLNIFFLLTSCWKIVFILQEKQKQMYCGFLRKEMDVRFQLLRLEESAIHNRIWFTVSDWDIWLGFFHIINLDILTVGKYHTMAIWLRKDFSSLNKNVRSSLEGKVRRLKAKNQHGGFLMNTSLGSEKGNQRQKGKKTVWVTGKVREFIQTEKIF